MLLHGTESCLAASTWDEEAQKGLSWLRSCPCQGHTGVSCILQAKALLAGCPGQGGADGTKTLGSVRPPPRAATHQSGVQNCWTNACWSPVCFRPGQERSQPGHTGAPIYRHIAGENMREGFIQGYRCLLSPAKVLQSNPNCTLLLEETTMQVSP